MLDRIPQGFFSLGYALAFFVFLVVELIAVARKTEGDTLSEHIWSFLDGGPARVIGFALVWCGVTVWLTLHFLWRGKHG